jgi:hypothetical protein
MIDWLTQAFAPFIAVRAMLTRVLRSNWATRVLGTRQSLPIILNGPSSIPNSAGDTGARTASNN